MGSIQRTVPFVLAALAVSAVAASTAVAAPEFVAEGGAKVAGTEMRTSGGASTLVTPGTEVTVKCASEAGTGKIASATAVNKVLVTYEGCKAFHNETECGDARTKGGATAGKIKPTTLKGVLGEVAASEAASERGLRLQPESGTTFNEIEFKPACNFINSTQVTGEAIGAISPKGVFTESGELPYLLNASNEQTIKRFVGGAEEVLEAFFFTSGMEDRESVTFVGKKIKVT